jgi:hypothetical protein
METYLYLNLGDGRATVAIQHNDDNTIEIGVAFCSPVDRFVKAVGRVKALERLKQKKDFYVRFDIDENEKLKWQVRDLVRFIVLGKWVTALDFETELDIKVHEIVTETVNDFPSDIAPMTVHTNTIPTWAKRAAAEKNFY